MRIRTRLAIGFLIVVAMILPAALLSLRTYRRIHQEFEGLRDDIIPGVLTMVEMEQAATQAHHRLMEYMVHGKEEDTELARSCLEGLKKAGLEHLEHDRHAGPEEQRAAEELLARTEGLSSAIAAIIDLKRQGVGADELSRKEDETVHPAGAALVQQIRAHKAVHMQELAEAEAAVHRAHVAGARIVALATACAALIALATALLTSRSIVRPLRSLQEGTRTVAGGDLDYRVGTARKDEVGELSRAFDRMTEGLSKTLVAKSALDEANAALKSEAAERERAQAALRESEQGLRTTLASIGDGVMATDTARRVTRLNKVAEELTGWSAEDARGRPLEEVFHIINEQTREPAKDPVARVLASGRIEGLANHTVLVARDGSERPIADSAAPICDASGRIAGVVLVFRDITGRRRAKRELQQRMDELEQFNRLAVGREERMIELKREVNEMARKAGAAPPYDLAFAESGKGGTDDET